MVLSDKEITFAIKSGELRILPSEFRLNPAGVDLRIDRDIHLEPKQQLLVASILFASLALVDPGFRGQLTVSLYNSGDSAVNLGKGERFIQLSLLRLGKPAINKYAGRYQNSSGVVASRRRKKSRTLKMESVIHGSSG
ncbi:hypothetical protein E6H37_00160 [Candidatus Bathyarchaeota archaeon]|nr:MAG: hypothetical protein E6H37_00160 [Candidatus Bathyarchaeota archaeon]